MSDEIAIKTNREQWLRDFKELLAVNSVRDNDHADSRHPYGPGPKAALDKLLSFATRDGFQKIGIIDDRAGYIEIGPSNAKKNSWHFDSCRCCAR